MSARIMPIYAPLTAERFLSIDFGEEKAELDRGVIRISLARPSAMAKWPATS